MTAALAGLAVPASGQATAPSCLVRAGHAVAASQAPLRFGIYPGGPVGSVHPKAPPRPEDPVKRLAALKALAGHSPFVVRLYSAWNGAASDNSWLDREIAEYTASGLQVELVVRYQPTGSQGRSAAAEFAAHVRAIVRRYGPNPRFVSLQVTNEANIAGAPDAADGEFSGATQALVKGVIAAKRQARKGGQRQLRVGFNWAYDERAKASRTFWARLARLGGRKFARAVDWVGLDAYPGSWSPRIALSDLLPGHAADALRESVRSLRDCYMPMAGLRASTPVHIAENGFPTGPGRSVELQAQTLAAMVRSVDEIHSTYGVTDYRWFDLRDGATADPNIESQYGITRDDYSPKPAFATYRDLISRYSTAGASAPAAPDGNCRSARVKVAVPRLKGRRPTSLVVKVGSRVVGKLRGSRIQRAVRISLRSGRSVVKLKLSANRRRTLVKRRTYVVC